MDPREAPQWLRLHETPGCSGTSKAPLRMNTVQSGAAVKGDIFFSFFFTYSSMLLKQVNLS